MNRIDFLAELVMATLHDARDGTIYPALNRGHFGVKLHRRDAGSETGEEIAVPIYPPQLELRKINCRGSWV